MMMCFTVKHFNYLNCKHVIDFDLFSQCLSESISRIFIKIQNVLI